MRIHHVRGQAIVGVLGGVLLAACGTDPSGLADQPAGPGAAITTTDSPATAPPETTNSPDETASPDTGQLAADAFPLRLDLRAVMSQPCVDGAITGDAIKVPGADGQITIHELGGGTSVVVLDAPAAQERPVAPVNRAAISSDTRTIVVSIDSYGADTIMASLDRGESWRPMTVVADTTGVAVSASGSIVAVSSSDGRLFMGAPTGELTEVERPRETELATTIAVTDTGVLYGTFAEPVPGVNPELAALSNLWARDATSNEWSRLTDLYADEDRWELAGDVRLDGRGGVSFLVRTGWGRSDGGVPRFAPPHRRWRIPAHSR